jgi:anti-anti-sigma regulatory factor/HAMP domain-containing protein
LLLTAGILIYLSFQSNLRQVQEIQNQRSRVSAGEINAYLDDLQSKLNYVARMRGLTDLSPEVQNRLLEGLTRHNSAFEVVAIADRIGRVISKTSLYGTEAAIPDDLANTPLFLQAFKKQADYVSPVTIDPGRQLPSVTMAVPIRDGQDQVAGVLIAKIDLKFLWFIVSQTAVGETGYAYIIDHRNVLIARKGAVLDQFGLEDLSDRPFIQALTNGTPALGTTYVGLDSQEVIGAIAPIRSVNWHMIVELPTAEAHALLRTMLIVMGFVLTAATIITAGWGLFLARRIVAPLQHLTHAAANISMAMTTEGAERNSTIARVELARNDELGVLADSFNYMAATVERRTGELETQYALANAARIEAEVARAEIAAQLATIEEQRAVIREMSVPALPISATTVVMPLVGALDSVRLRLVQEQALQMLERSSARYLLLDITGVPVVDTQVAHGLIQVVQAARLLSARVVVVGIRPEVAQALVGLGIDLTGVITRSTLQSGIAYTLGQA